MIYKGAAIALSIIGIVLGMFLPYPFSYATWAIFGCILVLVATTAIYRKKKWGINDARP